MTSVNSPSVDYLEEVVTRHVGSLVNVLAKDLAITKELMLYIAISSDVQSTEVQTILNEKRNKIELVEKLIAESTIQETDELKHVVAEYKLLLENLF